MRTSRMVRMALTTVAAGCALMPAAALAKAKRLELTWEAVGGPVHLLQPSEAVNLLLSSFAVQTRSGEIECSTDFGAASGLGGTDETNDEATDKVKLVAAVGVIGGETGCVESSAPDSPAVKVFLEPGEAILNLSGSKRRATIKRAPGGGPIELALERPGGLDCRYATNKLAGALKIAEPFPGSISLAFDKQRLKLQKHGSGAKCGRTVSVDAAFGSLLTTEGVSSFEGGPEILGRLG